MERENFSHPICPHTPIAIPILSIAYQSGISVTIDESALTHHFHQKPIVLLRFSLNIYSVSLDKYIMSWINTVQSNFTFFCAVFLLLSTSTPKGSWSVLPTCFFFFFLSLAKCLIVRIIQYAAFSDCLLSLSNMPFRFLHVFFRASPVAQL